MSADDRRPDRSILESLESEGRSAPRVRLRDDEEHGSAPLPSETDRLDARYERIGLIAEGAVGNILKSRDVDLGRSVAVKVLREEHLDDPEMIARFVEEAQIAGQLQHPGIVPVYELGIDADRRPWFAMKLVRGRSFAALLADRKDPSERLRRNLAIFERVCQAVSYAHARGVIHRDLKPSNVMLGAYGEIQVVDWGFARVLAHGGIADERRAKQEQREDPARLARKEGSRPGSMLGTPPYMSPEQAAGRLDEMDERSDVFSLGSILTEILTGRPAYTGDTEEILERAAEGRLEDAHARLDACGADEGIVEVAKSCLAPSRKARPRDAKVLADAVTDFMGQILARAHRAELEAIESKSAAVRAREEADRAGAEARETRRRRVRGIAVAAILLLTVVAAGGLWQWYLNDRVSTARESAEALDAALGQAALHQGREEWDEAVGAARRAVEVARAGSAGADDLRRAEALLARIEVGKKSAEEVEEKRKNDEALAGRLEAILLPIGRELDDAHHAREFAAAFREFGFDPESLTAEEAALVLRAMTRPEEFAAAVERWAMLRQDGWRKLMDIATLTAPNEVREKIWAASAGGNRKTLRAIAASGEIEEQPASVEALLGMALDLVGDGESAVSYLKEARKRHPGDVRILMLLARTHERRLPPARDELIQCLSAALAIRPDSVEIRHRLGEAHEGAGDLVAAVEVWRDAIERDADWAHGLVHVCRSSTRLGDLGAAVEAGRAALKLAPDDPEAHLALAGALAASGDHGPAAEACEEAVRRKVREPDRAHLLLGRTLLAAGRYAEAKSAFQNCRNAAAPGSATAEEVRLILDRWEGVVDTTRRRPEIHGGRAAATAEEAVAFARLCAEDRRFAAAAGYYERAFELEPGLTREHGADAAHSAGQAGRRRGKDAAHLSADVCQRWRNQARWWLEESFEPTRKAIARAAPSERTELAMRVHGWLSDPVLSEYLSRPFAEMKPYERQRWRELGTQLDATCAAARR